MTEYETFVSNLANIIQIRQRIEFLINAIIPGGEFMELINNSTGTITLSPALLSSLLAKLCYFYDDYILTTHNLTLHINATQREWSLLNCDTSMVIAVQGSYYNCYGGLQIHGMSIYNSSYYDSNLTYFKPMYIGSEIVYTRNDEIIDPKILEEYGITTLPTWDHEWDEETYMLLKLSA